ncbi:hypothetical protein WMY93_020501 [Mugilogobius chulae]|uniref:THAP-type domain-containing protein n=1 Tax=Mugilogobius chulae TaxID=88201 RepID=A0AAW0NIJ7_9GOBI
MPGSHCAVRDCPNGTRGLKKWKEEFCPIHDCNKGTSRCVCDPPYVLHSFPTLKKDPKRRAEWTKLINRKSIKTGENWEPVKNSRVCSRHFVDGAPSTSFPNPTLNLGDSVPSTNTGIKRAPPEPCTLVQAPKRPKLNSPSLSGDDEQNAEPTEEDTLKTSGSDPGTDVNAVQAHLDHTYTNTKTCNCQSDCNCDSMSRLSRKIMKLEDKLKMLGVNSDESFCSYTSGVDLLNNTNSVKDESKRCFIDRFLSDDKSVELNTGLPDKETFNKLLRVLTPKAKKMRYWDGTRRVNTFVQTPQKSGPGRKLSIKTEFLMVLMKLKQGLTNEFLASIFSISVSSCSNIITTWIKFLGFQLSGLVMWPDKKSVRTMLPDSLAKKYPNLRCILNCSETFIERPRDLKLQAATWSANKKHNTLKYLVGIAPNGYISFISKAWGGRTTGRKIVQQSGFLDLVDPFDLIMADRALPIQEDLLLKMAKLVIEPPNSDLEQMTINRLKCFQILSTTLPVSMAHLFDDILIICAGLCNLLPPLIVE